MFKESSASQGKGFANVDMESCENDMPFARAVGDNKRTLEAMTYQGTIGRGARPHTQKKRRDRDPSIPAGQSLLSCPPMGRRPYSRGTEVRPTAVDASTGVP